MEPMTIKVQTQLTPRNPDGATDDFLSKSTRLGFYCVCESREKEVSQVRVVLNAQASESVLLDDRLRTITKTLNETIKKLKEFKFSRDHQCRECENCKSERPQNVGLIRLVCHLRE